mgnify:CR=1 FL=1
MTGRPHDVGGQAAGPLDLDAHPEEDWHALVMALYAAAISADPPLASTHEYRRVMEGLPLALHRGDYHVRAVEALVALLEEKGLLTRAELEARAAPGEDG